MSKPRSEDELGMKWDRCLADTSVKMLGGKSHLSLLLVASSNIHSHSSGLTMGGIFSLLLFKKKAWPITFGIGTGFGMGYSNCEHDLNEPYMIHIKDLKKLEE